MRLIRNEQVGGSSPLPGSMLAGVDQLVRSTDCDSVGCGFESRLLPHALREGKGKMTIIITTHYMEEAESLSSRIGIMTKGKLIAIGTAKELMKKTNTQKFEDAFVEIVQRGE